MSELKNFDTDKLENLMTDIETNVEYFNKTAAEAAAKYTEDLD